MEGNTKESPNTHITPLEETAAMFPPSSSIAGLSMRDIHLARKLAKQ